MPKVNLADFGKLNFDSLPTGPDGKKMVATVNGIPITEDRLRSMLRKLMGPAAKADTPASKGFEKAVSSPALDDLAFEILYEEFAKKNGLQVTDADVEEELRQENAVRPAGRKLQDEAYAIGRTLDDVRRDLRVKRLAQKVEDFVGDQFTTGSITENDLKPFLLTSAVVTSSTPEVRAQHIVIRATPDMSPESIEDARLRAEKVLEQIRSGANFTQTARQASQDRRTTRNGGDLGYFTPGQMFPEFDQVAFSLKPGEVSEVVRTPVGFHIIKVLERNSSNMRTNYWEQLRIHHIAQWRTQLMRSASIQRFI